MGTLIILVAWLQVKCGWHCHVNTQLPMPSSKVDNTVKCRHSLRCRHQMWMTLSRADTACGAVIKCGWYCQVQTQLAMPSSNVDDTLKCRHSLPCHLQMWMTPSSARTAIIKCTLHCQVQNTACRAINKCTWQRQMQTQLVVPSWNADDTIKGRHSFPYHHQVWITPSSAHRACHAIIKCARHRQVQTHLSVPS